MSKRWLSLLSLGFLATGALAQTSDHPRDKPLVAAADVGFAPFSFKTPAGELTGFSVEFGREIARRLGRPGLEVIDQKFSVIFAGLFANRFELIIAPTNITQERAEQMLFSEPYMATGLGFLIRQEDAMKGVDDLKGKIVAVNNGSISDTWATENASKHGFEIQRYDKNADAVQAVLTRRAFANISEVPTVAYIATQQKALKVGHNLYTGRNFGLVFRKDDVEFRNEVEKIVEAMKKDGSLARLHEKWFGRPPDPGTAMTQVYEGFGAPGFPGHTR
ncbi:MAG TPA: transporter substrate-binding domain-containing protein [Methylomirabilota bacterium]|jgi:polar amino acid transport system substrate-binding protein|nr:transporter substrate-binding domain-containing protein [Methylomirabilota bacterium]